MSVAAPHRELGLTDAEYDRICELLDELTERGQVALRYAAGDNPNGSTADIAGVTNEAGNVLGLMPHPEHAVDALTGSVDGLALIGSPA